MSCQFRAAFLAGEAPADARPWPVLGQRVEPAARDDLERIIV
jgi:hypothetical protein